LPVRVDENALTAFIIGVVGKRRPLERDLELALDVVDLGEYLVERALAPRVPRSRSFCPRR